MNRIEPRGPRFLSSDPGTRLLGLRYIGKLLLVGLTALLVAAIACTIFIMPCQGWNAGLCSNPGSETAKSIAPLIAALIAACGVMITILANALLKEQDRETERTSLVNAIVSDIDALISALHVVIPEFVAIAAGESVSLPPWVDAPRKEDYFQLFSKVADKVGLLPQDLPRHVVQFYTSLKLSRDAAAPLAELRKKREEAAKSDNAAPNDRVACRTNALAVLGAIRPCVEAAVHIQHLHGDQSRQTAAKLLLEIPANAFLIARV